MHVAEEVIMGSCFVVTKMETGEGRGSAFMGSMPVLLEILPADFTGELWNLIVWATEDRKKVSGELIYPFGAFVGAFEDLLSGICGSKEA